MLHKCASCGQEVQGRNKFCSKACLKKGRVQKGGILAQLCPHGILGKKKCIDCQREYFRKYGKQWRESHKGQYQKRMKEWITQNPDKIKQYSRTYYWKNRETEILKKMTGNAKRHRKLRLLALTTYSKGVPQCSCCGEQRMPFLTIDHINGGGGKHRKQIRNIGSIYEWLKREKYPEGFRVLCMNCNHSLAHYGYCPHQEEKSANS